MSSVPLTAWLPGPIFTETLSALVRPGSISPMLTGTDVPRTTSRTEPRQV